MISQDLKDRVDLRLLALCEAANDRIPRFRVPAVTYYDNKFAAGRAVYRTNTIELNSVLLAENPADMLRETVAHELAHLIVKQLVLHERLPRSALRRPHGREWQRIMRSWLAVTPSRTHDYDTANVRAKRQRTWAYRCPCTELLELSTVRHNRALKGVAYRCGKCKQQIERIT